MKSGKSMQVSSESMQIFSIACPKSGLSVIIGYFDFLYLKGETLARRKTFGRLPYSAAYIICMIAQETLLKFSEYHALFLDSAAVFCSKVGSYFDDRQTSLRRLYNKTLSYR